MFMVISATNDLSLLGGIFIWLKSSNLEPVGYEKYYLLVFMQQVGTIWRDFTIEIFCYDLATGWESIHNARDNYNYEWILYTYEETFYFYKL